MTGSFEQESSETLKDSVNAQGHTDELLMGGVGDGENPLPLGGEASEHESTDGDTEEDGKAPKKAAKKKLELEEEQNLEAYGGLYMYDMVIELVGASSAWAQVGLGHGSRTHVYTYRDMHVCHVYIYSISDVYIYICMYVYNVASYGSTGMGRP